MLQEGTFENGTLLDIAADQDMDNKEKRKWCYDHINHYVGAPKIEYKKSGNYYYKSGHIPAYAKCIITIMFPDLAEDEECNSLPPGFR
jgi:hypothetical protein